MNKFANIAIFDSIADLMSIRGLQLALFEGTADNFLKIFFKSLISLPNPKATSPKLLISNNCFEHKGTVFTVTDNWRIFTYEMLEEFAIHFYSNLKKKKKCRQALIVVTSFCI